MGIVIYTDGGARGNPGPAAAGAVVVQDGAITRRFKKFLGHQTNNWAEYEAVILVLGKAVELGISPTEVRLDSMLVAQQLSGNWKIKEPELKKQWARAKEIIDTHFPHLTFTYVPREQNKEADKLVNEALDEASH